MTGLEKILSEIQTEAQGEAAAILQKAKDEASEILAKAKEESDAQCAKIAAAAEQDVADVERSRASALQLQRRQRTLQTKQQLLAETMQKARDSLYSFPEDTYFPLLTRLAVHAAQDGEGEMLLCAKDLARLPSGFEAGLAAALGEGKRLKLSSDTRPIRGGFVLKYGDVEENCSFEAIFAARKDEFSDKIQSVLFA